VAIQGRSYVLPIVQRAHLQDNYYRGTSPVVVADQPDRRYLTRRTTIARAHLVDDFRAGTQPAICGRVTTDAYDRQRWVLARTFIGRAHLVDTFYAGTQPSVYTAPVPRYGATVIQSRSSLVDVAAPATTLPPSTFVYAPQPDPRYLVRSPAIISRAHLEDTYYAGTQPKIIQPAPADTRRATIVTARAHLVDDFYAGTQPKVITDVRRGYGATFYTSRSSLVDVVVTPDALPRQVYVYGFQPAPVPGRISISRAHLVDEYRPGTQPLVVAAERHRAAAQRFPGTIFCRAHLVDDYYRGTQPLVVAAPQPFAFQRDYVNRTVLLRSPLERVVSLGGHASSSTTQPATATVSFAQPATAAGSATQPSTGTSSTSQPSTATPTLSQPSTATSEVNEI